MAGTNYANYAARRRKRVHYPFEEVDRGQPCVTCGDKCPGFSPHKWRCTCCNCGCRREEHDIIHDNLVTVTERLNLVAENAKDIQMAKERALGLGYSWAPDGLPPGKVEEFMNSLPNDQVPRLHTPGEKFRDRQLIIQIPKQDMAEEFCRHLGDATAVENFNQFLELREEAAFGVGRVKEYLPQDTECYKCAGEIEAGELAVFADRMDEEGICWHPLCFTCFKCDELVVDLCYFFREGQVYCERHYAELIMPRCASCDELIFSGEYVKAMNESFHSGHFCCQKCDTSLSGQSYILKDEKPHCVACYDNEFANRCEECGKTIGHDSKDLIFKGNHFHESCFEQRYSCGMCKQSLADKAFGNWDGMMCCLECYEKHLARTCPRCGEIIKPGAKRLGYQGKEWHDKCFVCKVCNEHIGTKKFVPKDDDIYCNNCYEESFGTRCAGCNKVIQSGGLLYRNEPWHPECFACSGCGKSIHNTRFYFKEGKRLCTDCFGEKFAPKCDECNKPILGQPGKPDTKYVAFQSRKWHNKCFNCKKCQTSLVGEAFTMDNDDKVICPNCAQE
ncbi:prickle planar cell polarity protein 3-B-like isoform X2 [Apostichopus japonicus]|uniref:prickle planar cell polarity protein 3-B-like isoform X2 n=1 Tax=Stichopus japonicus TaxID=307972 RepID=UPI003AB4CE06